MLPMWFFCDASCTVIVQLYARFRLHLATATAVFNNIVMFFIRITPAFNLPFWLVYVDVKWFVVQSTAGNKHVICVAVLGRADVDRRSTTSSPLAAWCHEAVELSHRPPQAVDCEHTTSHSMMSRSCVFPNHRDTQHSTNASQTGLLFHLLRA